MKADRSAVAVAKTGVQRAGGIRPRPGGRNGAVAFGKTGNLGRDMIQRRESGLFINQIVFFSIADQKRNALFLQKKKLLAPPLHFDFVLGAPGAMPGTVRNLVFLADTLPPGSTWTVAGIGPAEIPLATAAIAMGGHVRVGLEDNLHMPDGTLATNAALVATVATIARTMGRDVASPADARQILSLDPEYKDRILTQID